MIIGWLESEPACPNAVAAHRIIKMSSVVFIVLVSNPLRIKQAPFQCQALCFPLVTPTSSGTTQDFAQHGNSHFRQLGLTFPGISVSCRAVTQQCMVPAESEPRQRGLINAFVGSQKKF